MQLHLRQPLCHIIVDEVEDENTDEVDGCTCTCDYIGEMTLDVAVVHSNESCHHGDPVEYDGNHGDDGEGDQQSYCCPGQHHSWKLHPPEGWKWLPLAGNKILLPILGLHIFQLEQISWSWVIIFWIEPKHVPSMTDFCRVSSPDLKEHSRPEGHEHCKDNCGDIVEHILGPDDLAGFP